MRIASIVVLFAASTAWVGACSDDNSDKRPCPPQGIGVEEFNGVSAEDQLLDYESYACSQPQICPDLVTAAISPFYAVDPGAAPTQASVGLTNCSTGNQKLVIDQVVLAGDERCAFTCACRLDRQAPCEQCQVSVQRREVDPGQTISISIQYRPSEPGLDGGAFHVYSNAQNFQPAITPICVRAIDQPPAAGADGGVDPEELEPPRCESISADVNTRCHEPRVASAPSS